MRKIILNLMLTIVAVSVGLCERAGYSAGDAGNDESVAERQRQLSRFYQRSAGLGQAPLARQRQGRADSGRVREQPNTPSNDFANIRKEIMESGIRSMQEGGLEETRGDKSKLSELIDRLKGMDVGEFNKLEVTKSAGKNKPKGASGSAKQSDPNETLKESQEDTAGRKAAEDGGQTADIGDSNTAVVASANDNQLDGEQNKTEKKDKVLEKLLAQRIENGRAIDIADALYESGQIEKAAAFYRMADNYFRKQLANEVDINHYDRQWCLFQLGICLDKTEPEEAYVIYDELVNSYPDSYWAHAAKIRRDILKWRRQEETAALIKKYKFKTGK